MTTRPVRWIRLLLVMSVVLISATSCGQKGDLYHPEDGQSSEQQNDN